jgi:hypothetical protein
VNLDQFCLLPNDEELERGVCHLLILFLRGRSISKTKAAFPNSTRDLAVTQYVFLEVFHGSLCNYVLVA